MKQIVALIVCVFYCACCNTANNENPIKGTWKLVAISPDQNAPADSANNLGLAIMALSLALSNTDTFHFDADGSYTIKKVKGLYHFTDSTIYIDNNTRSDTFIYMLKKDTLSLRSTEKYVLQLKRIK